MRGSSSSVCSRFSAPSPFANSMRELLDSVHYDSWVLLALLAIPMVAAIGIWVHGAMLGDDADALARGGSAARQIALWAFIIEFIVSLGLWWSFDASSAAMQATFD